MPKSKHRKKPPNKAVKRSPATKHQDQTKEPPLYLVDGMLRLTRNAFDKVKGEHDFVNIVRVGRLLNCLCFGMQLIADKSETSTILEQRNHYRKIYLIGGYLYEGLLLIDDLWSLYNGCDFYSGFAALKSEKPERRRKIVQTIRDSVGFHLDWREKLTSATINKLDLPYVEFIAYQGKQVGDTYASVSDVVDLNYLMDCLKGEQSEPETQREIYDTLASLTSDMTKACDVFINGLIKRLKLTDYAEDIPKTSRNHNS